LLYYLIFVDYNWPKEERSDTEQRWLLPSKYVWWMLCGYFNP